MTIVTPQGFASDAYAGVSGLAPDGLAEAAGGGEPLVVDLDNDRDPATLLPWLDRIEMIRVKFPGMADGRGFSIARRLRELGYRGRLRAAGPLIADQAVAAWRVGFDDIEIPQSLAERQPESVWAASPGRSYRARLGIV